MEQHILNQSIEYILQHLQEELTVQQVADQFHFSEFYFNREFKKMTGESVYAFIKRQKLNQSAMEMKIDPEISITDIGEKYGYSSSNYSSAFKKIKNVSPAVFRKNANEQMSSNPFVPEQMECFLKFEEYNENISIQNIADIQVQYERFIGNYADLKDAWYQFMDQHAEQLRINMTMIERFYDDPKVVEVNQCICDLCLPMGGDVDTNQITTIKGGRFAVYRYQGKIEKIYGTLQGIFSIWLPQSSYQMDERYGVNIYREVDRENDFVVMDLCIPIQ